MGSSSFQPSQVGKERTGCKRGNQTSDSVAVGLTEKHVLALRSGLVPTKKELSFVGKAGRSAHGSYIHHQTDTTEHKLIFDLKDCHSHNPDSQNFTLSNRTITRY